MFDVGALELLVIVIVAIVVIGPKDMPQALRVAGRWVGKMRRVSAQFRAGFDNLVREAELEEMEKKWKAQNEQIMAEHPDNGTAAAGEEAANADADADADANAGVNASGNAPASAESAVGQAGQIEKKGQPEDLTRNILSDDGGSGGKAPVSQSDASQAGTSQSNGDKPDRKAKADAGSRADEPMLPLGEQ